MVTYDEEPQIIKSHVVLIKWWQTKNLRSLFRRGLWTPNLKGWWLMTWGQHSKNHMTIIKTFLSFITFLYLSNLPLILYRATIALDGKKTVAANCSISKSFCDQPLLAKFCITSSYKLSFVFLDFYSFGKQIIRWN